MEAHSEMSRDLTYPLQVHPTQFILSLGDRDSTQAYDAT
jgi:hypothetical protein